MELINIIKKIYKNERNKSLFINISGAFLVKGLSLLLSLFTMPAYILYFNNDKILGLWFTMLSVLSWVLSFDLGVGNGLRNKLSISFSKNENEKANIYISSAYIMIGFLSLGVFLLFLIFSFFIDWYKFFNISQDTIIYNNLFLSLLIIFACIMLQFFLKIINSILYSLQKSSINNFLLFLSSLIIFLFVKFAPSFDSSSKLLMMSIIYLIATNIPLLITSLILFIKSKKIDFPKMTNFRKNEAKEIISLGGLFFYIQILYILLIGTNEFFISKLTNTENVVDYQMYYKFYSLGSTVLMLALTPLWSSITVAISKKDIIWVKKIYKIVMVVTLICILILFCIIPFTQLLMNFLYKENSITVNNNTCLNFVFLGSVMMLCSSLSTIANGMGKLKVQSITYSIGLILKIVLSIILVNVMGDWQGVIIATSISLSLYILIEPILLNKYFRKSMGEKSE